MEVKKNTTRHGYKMGEFVVYPAHGVGQILAIEEQEVAGLKLEAVRDLLREGQDDAARSDRQGHDRGMRKLAENTLVTKALTRSRAAPASSAPCGRAAPRNTKPRSIPAT